MIKIRLEIEHDRGMHTATYESKKPINLKTFREIWRLLRDEAEEQIPFKLHHHGKKKV